MLELMCPMSCFIFESDAIFLCPAFMLDGIVEKLTPLDFIKAASLPPPVFNRSNNDDFANQSIYNLIRELGNFNITS